MNIHELQTASVSFFTTWPALLEKAETIDKMHILKWLKLNSIGSHHDRLSRWNKQTDGTAAPFHQLCLTPE